VTYLRGRGPRFVTVCDRGVQFVKSSVCIRYRQPLISRDYNYTNRINLTYISIQQILVVTFEFIGAAHDFMIMSCAARGSKRLDSTHL